MLARYRLNLPENKKVILFVGQMIYRKGIDKLLETISEVCMIREDIIFVLEGGELPGEYMKLYRSVPDGSIIAVPYMEKDELQYYYRSGDVFVLPTREDIWGLVVNEAMVHSLPVITTYSCGSGRELVKNAVNGFCLNFETKGEWPKIIFSTLDNSQIYGINSRLIIDDYTIENMAENHIKILSTQ